MWNFRSVIAQNIGALFLLQAANYIVPIVMIPYLTRVLGLEAFGLSAFVQVLMTWLVILVNYGFPWSATRDIAANRADEAYVSRQFSANWTLQWLLTLLAGATLTVAVVSVPELRKDAAVYIAGYSSVLGTTLFPIWLMQGLERLREVAIIQLFGRATLLILVFVFVRGPEDVALAVFAQGAGGIFSGLACLWWMRRQNIVRFSMPSVVDVARAAREGGKIFASRIAIIFYTTFVPTALGIVAGTGAVGQYSLADRVRGAGQAMMMPISQALFPRMSFLFSLKDVDSAIAVAKYSFIATILISGSASITIFIFSDWIVFILGGDEFRSAAPVLRWLSAVPFCVGLSNFFGLQILLPRREIRAFNTILVTAAVFGLAIIFPMATWRGAEGAAMTVLAVECWVTVAMMAYLFGNGLIDKEAIE